MDVGVRQDEIHTGVEWAKSEHILRTCEYLGDNKVFGNYMRRDRLRYRRHCSQLAD